MGTIYQNTSSSEHIGYNNGVSNHFSSNVEQGQLVDNGSGAEEDTSTRNGDTVNYNLALASNLETAANGKLEKYLVEQK